MNFHTIKWIDEEVEILDQNLLPSEEKYIRCQKYQELVYAIKSLQVRGAPLIGITAAYAMVMAAISSRNKIEFAIAVNEIKSARPTAVNLSWAVERMMITFHAYADKPERNQKMLELAQDIHADDSRMCDAIGQNGKHLLPKSGTVLTHCNAGALATGGCGTALGVVYHAVKAGHKIAVFADETRPILQGARLTSWELIREGIDVTLITDSMAGYAMSLKIIDCVIVGADRIAINYDIANKIGTYSLAVLAKHHNIPFYVAAPSNTFDNRIASGVDIVIEQRSPLEVMRCGSRMVAPENVKVYNPAFDITPNELITAIITDKEVIKCKRWEELSQ